MERSVILLDGILRWSFESYLEGKVRPSLQRDDSLVCNRSHSSTGKMMTLDVCSIEEPSLLEAHVSMVSTSRRLSMSMISHLTICPYFFTPLSIDSSARQVIPHCKLSAVIAEAASYSRSPYFLQSDVFLSIYNTWPDLSLRDDKVLYFDTIIAFDSCITSSSK